MEIIRVFLGASLAAIALPFAASAKCNYEIVTVTEWTAELVREEPSLQFKIDVALEFSGDRPVRMIDGSIIFGDVLGGTIGSMGIDRDLSISPGEAVVQSGLWGRNTFERLLGMSPEDVTTQTCIRGLVYADGEVENFNQ